MIGRAVRQFAQAMMQRSKNDHLDAVLLRELFGVTALQKSRIAELDCRT